jgi:hypothetical protein
MSLVHSPPMSTGGGECSSGRPPSSATPVFEQYLMGYGASRRFRPFSTRLGRSVIARRLPGSTALLHLRRQQRDTMTLHIAVSPITLYSHIEHHFCGAAYR